MSIEEAIAAYKRHAPAIFEEKWWTKSVPTRFTGHATAHYTFSGENLKEAVCKLLEKQGTARDLELKEDGVLDCKAQVIDPQARPRLLTRCTGLCAA